MSKEDDKQIEFYYEGMKVEKNKRYAFIFNSNARYSTVPTNVKPINMQATDGEGYSATIVIGNRFMKGIFIAADELKKVHKGWNNTLHDLNHMGSGYMAGFSVIPSDISYIVGYQNGLKFDDNTKAVTAKVHIDKESPRYDEWQSYANICNDINRPLNLSMYCFGRVQFIKAEDLGVKPSEYKKQGYVKGDTVPCMFDIQPYMVSTVTRGACDDKDGCGIENSNCEDNNCDIGAVSQDNKKNETNPEDAERKAYLVKRVKQMKRKK